MSCCDCGPWVVCPLHTNYDQPQSEPEQPPPPPDRDAIKRRDALHVGGNAREGAR